MKIGLDLDEVLASLMDSFLKFHNSAYHTNLTREDCHTYYTYKNMGISREEEIRRLIEFYQTNFFHETKPVPGSQEGVSELSKHHNLEIITYRHPELEKDTREFIEEYYPGRFSEIHFAAPSDELSNSSGLATPSDETPRKKSDICLARNMPVLIEDNLETAFDSASKGIRVILLDCPWNQGNLIAGIERVFSWKEIPGLLNSH